MARPFLLGPDCGTTFFYVKFVAPRQHSRWGGRFSYSVPHVAATLCPRFHSLSLHSLSLHSLSLYSLSLPLPSLSSLPLSDGLSRRSLSLKQVFFFDVGCRSPRRVSRLHNVDDSGAYPVYGFNHPTPPPPVYGEESLSRRSRAARRGGGGIVAGKEDLPAAVEEGPSTPTFSLSTHRPFTSACIVLKDA